MQFKIKIRSHLNVEDFVVTTISATASNMSTVQEILAVL